MSKRAVLIYVIKDKQVLLIYGKQPYAPHYQKYNGLGGKIEQGETTQAAAIRETRQEGGLTVREEHLDHVGQIRFLNCRKAGSDWTVDVFRVSTFTGEATANEREGHLQWFDTAHPAQIPTNAGDQHFLPWIFAGRYFDATVTYDLETGIKCVSCTPTFRD